jgi:BirA family biotin operon repressor/biotin-[acetyl-CoA-carboxylase] ligase
VRLHPVAESTNALAVAAPERGLVVVAHHQTAGRGRLGREWVTPAGAALTFSAVVDPGVDDEWWPLVPLVAGYAVARAVGGSLKWPNDVLVSDPADTGPGGKVCGILVERVVGTDGRPLAVVGVGINVDQTAAELPVPGATSLALAGRAVDRTQLFGHVLHALRQSLAAMASGPAAYVGHLRRRCTTLGRDVRADLPDGSVLRGRAVDLDDHGRLLVETGEGTVAVAAGDVVHVRPAE